MRIVSNRKALWIAVTAAALALSGAAGYFVYDRFYDHRELAERQARRDRPYMHGQPATGARLALEDALQIAQREVPGEVIKVERDREHGVDTVEIKILAATGRIREITLDAQSGAVLAIEDD